MKTSFKILAAAAAMTVALAACKKDNPNDGEKTVAVTGVTLSKATAALAVGDTLRLTAAVAPDNATNKTVAWTSSNTAVATVADGKVTAVAVGTATITVKTADGSKTAACEVMVAAVVVPVEGVSLNHTEYTLAVGAAFTLTHTITPANATNKAVAWASSNSSIATVADGTVTAVAAGSATITVTTDNGSKTAACTVTVVAAFVPVESVTLSEVAKTLMVGNTFTLTHTITPANATNKAVAWASSDNSIATVADGTVTAVAAGSATITVTTDDGSKTAACTVTVANLVVNGVVWADYNVDDYQQFAEKPDMYTKFYQWNRSTAWAATGSVSGWNSTPDYSSTWTINPCPVGWRLPTHTEFLALHNAGSTWSLANERGNAVAGRFYGPNHASCTLPNSMNDCVFLPAVGFRNDSNGSLLGQGSHGSYWSATQSNSAGGYDLHFYSTDSHPSYYNDKAYGFSLRCVR